MGRDPRLGYAASFQRLCLRLLFAVRFVFLFRPGVSGQIFAALGQAGINIRMINQGPDELNIIFGVDNRDFSEAIRVLYNSFVK